MTESLIGIIPAAGSGVRARPYSYEIHKGLFAIDGKSNIERTIDIMRDDLGITEVIIIVGYMGDAIRSAFGDGSDFGVRIVYVENQHLGPWVGMVSSLGQTISGWPLCMHHAE